ncbi:Endo-1,4-beta-xylanase [Caldicellulosiruptor owensensis OL]|uniref:Beta-xylanase n=1 Tax=Caldicellulosiruptor owensensis (strain ATCC 700167 / DSM 13100 / OL) TaxID=632518 RepID=E4Q5G9_CALOW|nr:endo-1,4-beta-xylanase [Caldicellulosiruptor owensensis]ADQ05453.1 Endo-1,4-beta-xylanase [Caldicellulosiruptor owensensis OL]
MKRRLVAFLIVLVFVLSIVNPAYFSFLTPVAKAQTGGTNLRFDFENGTQGWGPRGVSTTIATVYEQAYEGSYSLKVSGRSSTWDGAVVDITSSISANVTYTVSLFVRHSDIKPQRFSVYARVIDGSSEKYIQIADKVVMPNFWKQLFGKFTIATANPVQKVELLVCVPSNKSLEFFLDNVIVTSAQPASSGLVKSCTFESGGTEGWQARGTGSDAQVSVVDTVAHSGSKSLYVTGRAATWQGAQIDMTSLLEKGKEYQFSIWVYQNSGSEQKITLTMLRKNEDNSTNYDTIKWQQTVASGQWTEVTGSYTVPQTATQLIFYVESPNINFDFYLDDFTAVDKNPPVVNPGLVKSCTFESGSTEGFVQRGSASLTVVDGVYYHSPTKALYVTGRTATWQGAQIDMTSLLEKGKEYQFSIWVYQNSGSEQKITLTMQRKNEDNSTNYDTIKWQQTVASGQWTEVTGSYTVPQTATQLIFYVESPNINFDFYLDDFTVIDKNPITVPTAAKEPEWEIPSLCQQYSQYFSIGVAIPYRVLQNPVERAMVLKHFNSITAENEMKPDALQRTEGNFTFDIADQYVNFAQQNGIGIRGHTLVWHSQVPDWFFQHSDGTPLDPNNPDDKQLLRDRLKNHIQTVMSRYKGKVYAWDVVNEAIDESQPDGYRRSEWYRILGPTPETNGIPEYIVLAFQYARQTDPDAKLFYNDYNTETPKKRQFIYNMVTKLHEMGLIDGVGLQGHINVDSPTVKDIETTINLFSTIPGLEIQITELDISVYTGSSQRYDTLPQDVMIKQAMKFKELFEMLKRHSDRVTNVTLWGLKDDYSWLSKDRNNWPLLFDSNYQAKYNYWAIVEPSVLPLAINKASALNATATIDGIMDREYKGAIPVEIKDDAGNIKAVARMLWNANELYLYVNVNDSTYNPDTDFVMVCIDQDNAKLPELKPDDFWAIITRGGVLTELQNGKIAAYKVVTQQDSYVVEAKIILDNQLVKGANIGFDLAVRDDANVYSWNDKTNSQLYTTDNYGILSMSDNIKFATVYKGTPKIDGNEDPIWEFATQIKTETPIQVSGTVYAAAYANVKLLWDETAIYVWADVYDPLLNKANANPWEQDSIEIFVDENNHKTPYYEDDDVQYRVNYENTQTFGTNGYAQNFVTSTKITPFGYTVEAKVYMRTTTLSEGTIIGFDVQVNDADHTGRRVNVITWNDRSGNDWRDTTGFGCIELALFKNANLKQLAVSPGILSPGFSKDITAYTVTVPYETSSITVTAVPEIPSSLIYINDVQGNTKVISLNVGVNIIRVKVVADDNSEKIYTITVTRNAQTTTSPTTVIPSTPSTGTSTPTTTQEPQQTQQQQQQTQTQTQTQTTVQQQQQTQPATSQNTATIKLEDGKPTTVNLGQDTKVIVTPDAVTNTNAVISVEKVEKVSVNVGIGSIVAPAVKLNVENADLIKPVKIEVKVDPVNFKDDKIPVAFVVDETNKLTLVPVKKDVNKVVINTNKEGTIVVVAAKLDEVYKDITKNHWAYDTFKQAVTSGLVVGYNDMTLKPAKNVTLAEAAVIVQRAFEVQPKDTDKLPDVPGWAATAIKALLDNEIFAEIDNTNKPITRIQAVSIIMKALEKAGVSVESDEVEFSDISEQSLVDVEYLAKAYKLGIVKGYPDGTFKPNKEITRAEFLTLLFRALSNLKK